MSEKEFLDWLFSEINKTIPDNQKLIYESSDINLENEKLIERFLEKNCIDSNIQDKEIDSSVSYIYYIFKVNNDYFKIEIGYDLSINEYFTKNYVYRVVPKQITKTIWKKEIV